MFEKRQEYLYVTNVPETGFQWFKRKCLFTTVLVVLVVTLTLCGHVMFR